MYMYIALHMLFRHPKKGRQKIRTRFSFHIILNTLAHVTGTLFEFVPGEAYINGERFHIAYIHVLQEL